MAKLVFAVDASSINMEEIIMNEGDSASLQASLEMLLRPAES